MKFGIFSDVHANLPALEAVLEFLNGKVEKYLCCGDIVGYGPHPNECVQKIAGINNVMCVVGNHDWGVLGLEDILKFNDLASWAVKWTKEKLTGESVSFLMNLDYKLVGGDFIVVHGSLVDPLDQYVMDAETYLPSARAQTRPILFNGHTHQPLYFKAAGGVVNFGAFIPGKAVQILPGSKYLINVGSVGQPRDGNPKSACVIYDNETKEARLYRIEYDISKTQNDMRMAGIPQELVERLAKGV